MLSKGRIKELTSLHQKKYRSARNMFLAEGDKLVKEALRSEAQVLEVFAVESWDGATDVDELGIPLHLVTERELGQICELKNPNAAVALVAMPEKKEASFSIKGNWNLYMDRVRDPGNLGTVLRIADWFGMDRIICSPDSVEGYNQKVIQASMGAIFRIPIIEMEAQDLADRCKAEGVPYYAAVMGAQEINKMKPGPEGLIMMGNEAQGLENRLIQEADKCISIAGKGAAESLNVAVATGILMHWIYTS